MQIQILPSKDELGSAAAERGYRVIVETIKSKGNANIILATGTSQFDLLKYLVQRPVDWSKVVMFHLDEYIGISMEHAASFRRYLKERFVDKVNNLKAYYFINGNTDQPQRECDRLNKIINEHPIDAAFVGIGENGHLAFNDPPADFNNPDPYIVVELDKKCREQQMGEGWFKNLKEVPGSAISMSVKQIMKSNHILCSVPDQRKAEAVKNCFTGPVTNIHPASILQNHRNCTVFLDDGSSSLLDKQTIKKYK